MERRFAWHGRVGFERAPSDYDPATGQEKAGTRGEPFDLFLHGWAIDFADAAGFFQPLLGPELRPTGNQNFSYFRDPRVSTRIEAANRLSGSARRKAWTDLNSDLMRNDPPWAPIIYGTSLSFVSRSYGCFVPHPVYSFDIAAACKK